MEWLTALFESRGLPHGYCIAWDPRLLWAMVIGNGLVALAGALFAQTNGFADVYMVNSQLDGGPVSSLDPDSSSTCTAVSYGSGTSFNFVGGPVGPCP